jgi:NAD(P)-dependent dehydrogenase (short-subunit alcohol dehydrogenase family)
MNSDFKNKVVLVTGSGRGIGRACALAFAAQGCRVALVSRTPAELAEVAHAIGSTAEVLTQVADVAREADVQAVFEAVRLRWGGVDILVNNAAVFAKALVVDHSVEEWDRVMGVNVRGVFTCSRELFRQKARGTHGRCIVNIASLGGVRGTEKFAGLASYTASKFAVVGLSESLAVEGRALGIRVNCIAPGAVDTRMLKEAAPHLKTNTTPDQIAQTVLMLADEARSGHLNGSLVEIFSNVV